MAEGDEIEWGPLCEHSLVCAMDCVAKWWGDGHGAYITTKIKAVFRAVHVHCDPGFAVLADHVRKLRSERNMIREMICFGFYFDDELNEVIGNDLTWSNWSAVSGTNSLFICW